jgi:hypothetical protein
MPTRAQTNTQNLQKLIARIQSPNNDKGTQIAYQQIRNIVLLGDGHSANDTTQMKSKDHYEGILMLSISPNQRLNFFIDGDIIRGRQKAGRQEGDKVELEDAIKKALQDTPWILRFEWAG